jgi:CRISPR/Cas system-associated exonuclease Cas4 (RecB family)
VNQQYDSTASATSIAIFAACPRRYYLSRYLGLEPEPEGPGTGAIQTGLRVHEALAGKPAASPEVQRLADNFRNSEWGRRAARAQRAEHEFDFLVACEDMVLRGQIDLWFEEGGELVVVDYKTDRDESSAATYALQLQIYALGLEPHLGRLPDRAILFYVRPGNAIEVGVDRESLDGARAKVRELREAQEAGAFPVRPGDQCQKCSFWSGLCPEGRGEGVRTGLIFGPPSSSLAPPSGGS